MKIFNKLINRNDFTKEDYATADESELVGDDL